MVNLNRDLKFTELNPKQPEFVLVTSDYSKKYLMKYNLSHFYQFTAETDKMGVIPDACVDILFWKKDGKIKTKIAGSLLEKGVAETEMKCEYFGIRFLPGVNPVSGIVNLSELINNEESFEDMITSYEDREILLENMYFANSFEKKIKIFMNYYVKQFDRQIEDRNSLKYVIRNEIINSNGNIKLADLSAFTGYSERYLNAKIHESFGMNPKSLIRFIRFQKSVSNLINTIHCINSTDTALESGYYDQSHFIKEFIKFTGLTPVGYIDNLLSNSYDKKLHVIS